MMGYVPVSFGQSPPAPTEPNPLEMLESRMTLTPEGLFRLTPEARDEVLARLLGTYVFRTPGGLNPNDRQVIAGAPPSSGLPDLDESIGFVSKQAGVPRAVLVSALLVEPALASIPKFEILDPLDLTSRGIDELGSVKDDPGLKFQGAAAWPWYPILIDPRDPDDVEAVRRVYSPSSSSSSSWVVPVIGAIAITAIGVAVYYKAYKD